MAIEDQAVCTRRRFLGAAGAAAALTVGSGPFLKAAEADPGQDGALERGEEVFPGVCHGFCGNGCFLNVHVKDGIVTRTSARDLPDPDYNRICHKGYTSAMRIYSPERVLHPMRRVGERGGDQWEQITWDEAIQEIAAKYKEIVDEYGYNAFGFHFNVGSFSTMVSNAAGPCLRFQSLAGMSSVSWPADQAYGFGTNRMFGSGLFHHANEPKDLLNAKTIFIWGANPAISQMQSFHFISEARDKGAKVICIDPVYNTNAALSDEYVPIRSATDGALALGMMNTVLENGWEDLDFIANHSVAPFLVNPETELFVRTSDLGLAEAGSDEDVPVVVDAAGELVVPAEGVEPQLEAEVEVNGVVCRTAYSLLLDRIAEWPASRAAEVTGISEEKIVELARAYACDTPASVYTFFGTDHYYNGHWNAHCMGTLGVLTGNMGKPGAFIGIPNTDSAGLLNVGWNLGVPNPNPEPMSYNGTQLEDIVCNHSYYGRPAELHGMYVQAGNPVANTGNRSSVLEGFKNIDFLVVADMMHTETSRWADIVLPVCYWFEYENVSNHWLGHPHMMFNAKAIDPVGEAKTDLEIYRLLAQAIGIEDGYFPETTGEWLQSVLDSDVCRELGITYDELKEKGALRGVPGDEPYIFAEGGVFPTSTGRAEFYIENPSPTNDAYPDQWDFSKERLPYWEPPYELPNGSAHNDAYPYQLMIEHSRFRTHTQWSDVELLQEIDTDQFIYLNDEDAAELGIGDGDTIRISNGRGYLVGPARIRPNNARGIVSCVKGWTENQVIEGHLADVAPSNSNPVCDNQYFNDCAVAVEKM